MLTYFDQNAFLRLAIEYTNCIEIPISKTVLTWYMGI